MDTLISLSVLVILLAVGFFAGRAAEARHYRSIRRREQELAGVFLLHGKYPPPNATGGQLVMGSVVVSVDYFKRFLSGLRKLVGGRLTAYESLLDRARREAVLRMKAGAAAQGYNAVVNVRMETSSVSQSAEQGPGSVELLAFGTAVHFNPQDPV